MALCCFRLGEASGRRYRNLGCVLHDLFYLFFVGLYEYFQYVVGGRFRCIRIMKPKV